MRVGRELLREHLADFPRLDVEVELPTGASLAKATVAKPRPARPALRPSDRCGGSSMPSRNSAAWRRLARCYEGSQASAKAWLEVASMGYLLGRA